MPALAKQNVSKPLSTGGFLQRADGTAWMGF
jgi:hypothetical protein